jgi:hypothetical protein
LNRINEVDRVGIQPDQLRLSPDERADLVAYVDGELPEAHSRSISTKLTQSATARREVEMLQKTWEMLDHLALPQATDQFADKTVSHIRRLEMKGQTWMSDMTVWSARLVRVFAYFLVGVVCAGAGFSLARWVWPDPTRRLVEDLTLAEHLDEYLEVGSFDFLSQLADSKQFGTDAP